MKIPPQTKKKIFFGLIGVIVIIVGVVVTVVLVQRQQRLSTQASPEEKPKEVRITNLTENSFAVSWITDAPVLGSIASGVDENSLETVTLEDQSANEPANVHHVTVRPVKPNTIYFFEIISGGGTYDNDGVAFSVTTPSVLGTPPPPQTVYGSVLGTDGGALSQRAVVYVEVDGSTPISAVVNPANGNYSVSISTSRSAGLTTYASFNDATLLSLFVQGGLSGTATSSVSVAKAQPVPTMTLGQTFKFEQLTQTAIPRSVEEQELVEQVGESLEATPSAGEFTTSEVGQVSQTLRVTSINEGDTVVDTTPTFAGTAPAGAVIQITVESDPQTSSVVTNSDGTWSWVPPDHLPPGEHTLNVSFVDTSGKTVTQQVTFTVLGASASPSATTSGLVTPTSQPTLPEAGVALPTLILLAAGLVTLSLPVLLLRLMPEKQPS